METIVSKNKLVITITAVPAYQKIKKVKEKNATIQQHLHTCTHARMHGHWLNLCMKMFVNYCCICDRWLWFESVCLPYSNTSFNESDIYKNFLCSSCCLLFCCAVGVRGCVEGKNVLIALFHYYFSEQGTFICFLLLQSNS